MTRNHRYIARIDQPKKRHYGWWVRLRWHGLCHQKWFPDRHNGGKSSALLAAVAWRNSKCDEIGKPLTWRTVVTCNPRNRTGIVGIERRDGHYEITWAPLPNKVSRTTVSIKKHGERKALAIAKRIRRKKEIKIYGQAYQ